MIKIKTTAALTAVGLALAIAGPASAQTRYQTPTTGSDIMGTLLGALFGAPNTATQTLENDWSRGGRPLSERRQALDARIDAGIRDGSLSRSDAEQLRAEYNELVRIEANYAADGRLTSQEQADLSNRYDALSRSVRQQRRDDDRRWQPLAERRTSFDAQVNAALNDRTLNRTEAARLRTDFQALVQLEASYGRNGLDARETADLSARYDQLRARLGDDDDRQSSNRWASLEQQIATSQRSGAINSQEAIRMRAELGDLTRLDAAYAANGLNADERDYLNRRFGEVSARLSTWRR